MKRASPPGQFIALQTFNELKETILGYDITVTDCYLGNLGRWHWSSSSLFGGALLTANNVAVDSNNGANKLLITAGSVQNVRPILLIIEQYINLPDPALFSKRRGGGGVAYLRKQEKSGCDFPTHNAWLTEFLKSRFLLRKSNFVYFLNSFRTNHTAAKFESKRIVKSFKFLLKLFQRTAQFHMKLKRKFPVSMFHNASLLSWP